MKVMTRTLINMVLLLTASIIVQDAVSAEVSARLRIPDRQTLLLSTKGVGYQIYTSELKAGSTTEFEWKFKDPVATLYSNSREKIGTHYAGPTWEGNDGSKVMAKNTGGTRAGPRHSLAAY